MKALACIPRSILLGQMLMNPTTGLQTVWLITNIPVCKKIAILRNEININNLLLSKINFCVIFVMRSATQPNKTAAGSFPDKAIASHPPGR